ncbi:uncharacterized protein MONBRDRAFT_34381 [Monosiga brevicollis MX1]|uniref:Uncharacterized protein n=1 Tax=Monosiga brevicollis TaxID=81824 RepID=A9VBA2_MONBE|nr:uncharacterized protein MONBRDRAFT_34381 [Monosiga brevicollis MX1]EDQ85202.1 predicted protein [Monosiga brevicollis MX1]|eukprot:XP_001750027.1 hypothetical protein [Monosiga brevicollis MX1]
MPKEVRVKLAGGAAAVALLGACVFNLFSWAQVNAECPICKGSFRVVIKEQLENEAVIGNVPPEKHFVQRRRLVSMDDDDEDEENDAFDANGAGDQGLGWMGSGRPSDQWTADLEGDLDLDAYDLNDSFIDDSHATPDPPRRRRRRAARSIQHEGAPHSNSILISSDSEPEPGEDEKDKFIATSTERATNLHRVFADGRKPSVGHGIATPALRTQFVLGFEQQQSQQPQQPLTTTSRANGRPKVEAAHCAGGRGK